MNSAFACEALVSTLLRIGALPHLVRERQTLRPLLRANFFQKLEVLHAYTILFERPLDLRAPVVPRVRALMEKRNKYVHAEQSEHTRLDDVFFDDDFPLYGGGLQGQVMEFFGRTWLVPSKGEAADSLDCANAFRTFIFDSMHPARREEMEFMLDQPQLGYNLRNGRNSVVFPVTPLQSAFILGVPNKAHVEDVQPNADGSPEQAFSAADASSRSGREAADGDDTMPGESSAASADTSSTDLLSRQDSLCRKISGAPTSRFQHRLRGRVSVARAAASCRSLASREDSAPRVSGQR